MPKIRKVHRKKKFRANVNRKRLRNKLRKLPTIECKEIKEAWSEKSSIATNLTQMGLAYDPNKVLQIPNIKKHMLQSVTQNKIDGTEESDGLTTRKKNRKVVPRKAHVAKILEEEANWPRARLFRLPNNEVQFATYMMDKYGDDYEAMARDHRNYYQLTSCQIRRKIEKFKSIPEQYAKYLVEKGEIVLDDPTPLKEIKPQDILVEPVKSTSKSKKSRRKKQANLLEAAREDENNDEVDFTTVQTLNDDDEVLNSKEVQSNGEKKLKLFSDDENIPDESDGEVTDDDGNCSDSDENTDMDEGGDEGDMIVNITRNKSKSKSHASNSLLTKMSTKNISKDKTKKITGQLKTQLISRKTSMKKQKSKKFKLK
ncbi:uncharacterized protein LOC106645288 [Copidosoma floridanum]|uniref:uncharacterized protein LOC106645288 n=1 Tax=Copidosoma floridanum TaxID=29053 RepID=UPI0006C9CDD2|nr:uncharacterized protein LOC106645288 [Copidosoma floridanum]